MEILDEALLKSLGGLTKTLRKEVSQLPKIGLDITTLIDFIEKKIFSLGYLPAFPCTVSVNDMAAHYTVFDEGYLLKTGDVIKIDFGISSNGFITDNAVTVEIGTNEYEDLMKANFEGLNAAFEKAEIGVSMGEIGGAVHAVAKRYGFETIHNLTGHQIGRNNLHCGHSVPNYDNKDPNMIAPNMQFAIEPFFTKGEPKIKAAGPSNILHLINDKPVRDPIAKKILSYIKKHYPKLPFSKRWLVDEIIQTINPKAEKAFDKKRVLYALRILKQHNIIYEYEALATVDGSIVTQYEDVVLFSEKGEKTIITRL